MSMLNQLKKTKEVAKKRLKKIKFLSKENQKLQSLLNTLVLIQSKKTSKKGFEDLLNQDILNLLN